MRFCTMNRSRASDVWYRRSIDCNDRGAWPVPGDCGGPGMRIHGIVRTAALEENPPSSDRIEMVLRVQGVRPDQPRMLVIPYDYLILDESLDPDLVQGRGFEAEVSEDESGRWVVSQISFALGRVLREPEGGDPGRAQE